jgi:hypothetical protein
MAHDREYFRRRSAETRSGFHKDDCDGVEVAGHLALAYAALARRRGLPPKPDAPDVVDAIEASPADAIPLMLQD